MENLRPSAVTYTVTLTVDDAANYYDDDQKQNEVKVKVIDGLTVIPPEAYIAVNKTKAFYAWTIEGGIAVDVTAQSTFSADRGSCEGNIYTAPGSSGTDWVKATYQEQTTDEDHDSDVTIFDVEIDTPASFPAYVAVNEQLQLGSTVTPAAAGGGTYSWSKVTGPGNVTFSPGTATEDPTFKADAAGTYTVKVEYTKDGSTASDTSGNIIVVGAESLVLKDKKSGGYKVDQADGGPPPPDTLYVAPFADGKGDVEFWVVEPEGGATYDWEIKEDANLVDSGTLSAGNSYKDESADLSPDEYYLRVTKQNGGDFERKINFTVFKVEMKSIKFTSDHGVLKDNNLDWTDSDTTYAEPEWVKDPARNNPISHTKNIALTVDVTVKVEPSGLHFDLTGDGPNNYVDFVSTGNTSTGADQAVTITASAALPNQVDTLSKSISWDIKLTDPSPDIEEDVGTSGAHKIYVTYGTPSGSVVTEKRISWATATVDGQSSLSGIADAIYNDFWTPPPYFELGADAPDPLWLLMAGSQYKGECIDQANLMKLAVEILGGSASIGFIYGSSDTDCYSTSSSAHESRICPSEEHGAEKIYVYAGGGWNNWEAVCVVSGKYYAVQIDSDTSPVNILRTWLGTNQPSGNHQAWIDAGGICEDPGPYPVPKP